MWHCHCPAPFARPDGTGELPVGLRTLLAFMTADREELGALPVVPPPPVLEFVVPPDVLVYTNPALAEWKQVIRVCEPPGRWVNIGVGSFSDAYAAETPAGTSAVVKRYRHPVAEENSLWREACAYSKLREVRNCTDAAGRPVGGRRAPS